MKKEEIEAACARISASLAGPANNKKAEKEALSAILALVSGLCLNIAAIRDALEIK